ncbi:MAG TPA: PDZ domain-containing protein [Povalibacter sp.]|uniref:PDZ domain-containing protein n=1 Tax=Povalibacter sp. TaxID=1962978 RepID=UPI002CDE3DD9|nr:PDZ domain-containing protein [Povalibacter sp.]HMN43217.1 PDZ domain-containing protein [Povalibacter sp.]
MKKTAVWPTRGWLAAVSCVLLACAAQAASDDDAADRARAENRQKLEAAQRRLDEAAREVANLSMSKTGDVEKHLARVFPKAVLGLVVPVGRGDTRDDGAEVLSVSPGGGAAEAGLRAGDILMEINGKPMKRTGDQGPGEKVRAAVLGLNPDEKVTVKYLRDGKPATSIVVAKAPSNRLFNFQMAEPMAPGRFAGAWPPFAFRRADSLFGQAELVPLTPKLGQYFGTEKGLLVVRAPSDTRLKLEEGDVILDIDGRVPSSPSHALQILTSYEAGEKLKLNVLRMKKRITFDVTIPEDAQLRGSRVAPPADVLIPVPAIAPVPAVEAPAMRREIRIGKPRDEAV